MSKIRVKNFGPIKEGFNENDGFLDIKKVTVFIGNQGTGKSTVAKLISTCKWLEKAMNRGDIESSISRNEFFRSFNYQQIRNYFLSTTELEFNGAVLSIFFNQQIESFPTTKIHSSIHYNLPKLMYVPSERNFLSTVKEAFDVKGLPYSLLTFAEELRKAQKELGLGEEIELPIKGFKYAYNGMHDKSYIIGETHSIDLYEASSGLQSATPLFLVSRNLALDVETQDEPVYRFVSPNQVVRMSKEIALIQSDKSLSENEKDIKESAIRRKYRNSCFINIVEEPEQNLFPDSQRHILNSLLGFANKQEANELLMTTHSPYIINYLSLAIQGKYLLDKINYSSKKEELLPRLNAIVPIEACVAADEVAVYQFQNDGSICRLGSYEGIPSDKNYLNQSLAEGNQLFDALLELEEEL